MTLISPLSSRLIRLEKQWRRTLQHFLPGDSAPSTMSEFLEPWRSCPYPIRVWARSREFPQPSKLNALTMIHGWAPLPVPISADVIACTGTPRKGTLSDGSDNRHAVDFCGRVPGWGPVRDLVVVSVVAHRGLREETDGNLSNLGSARSRDSASGISERAYFLDPGCSGEPRHHGRLTSQ